MKKNQLKLAVAGAVLVLGSTVANAGIIIPAGDWTVDLGGNINTFYSNTNFSGQLETQVLTGGVGAGAAVVTNFNSGDPFSSGNGSMTRSVRAATTTTMGARAAGTRAPLTENANQISTGLLPSAIGIGAKTRQNDLDVAIQTTFFVGANSASGIGSTSGAYGSTGAGGNSLNIRQAFLSFGDKSWGTIKMGRDLGVVGSDAILSDMTLLGVGTGAGGAGNSTLGRIGSGYLYADWVGQIQYQSPNFSGFQVTGALREPLGNASNSELGYEGKATFDFSANDVSGRVWVGGLSQKISTATVAATTGSVISQTSAAGVTTVNYLDAVAAVAAVQKDAQVFDVGAKVSFAGLGLVGYYYDGQNIGTSAMLGSLAGTPGSGLFLGDSSTDDRNVKGGYVQATYKLPVGTTIGASWGQSKIDQTGADRTAYTAALTGNYENESWIVGAYHPITKHLNLVGEYTNTEYQNIANFRGYDGEAKTFAAGAILFF